MRPLPREGRGFFLRRRRRRPGRAPGFRRPALPQDGWCAALRRACGWGVSPARDGTAPGWGAVKPPERCFWIKDDCPWYENVCRRGAGSGGGFRGCADARGRGRTASVWGGAAWGPGSAHARRREKWCAVWTGVLCGRAPGAGDCLREEDARRDGAGSGGGRAPEDLGVWAPAVRRAGGASPLVSGGRTQ